MSLVLLYKQRPKLDEFKYLAISRQVLV